MPYEDYDVLLKAWRDRNGFGTLRSKDYVKELNSVPSFKFCITAPDINQGAVLFLLHI
jgi:hypothetical protein